MAEQDCSRLLFAPRCAFLNETRVDVAEAVFKPPGWLSNDRRLSLVPGTDCFVCPSRKRFAFLDGVFPVGSRLV